VVNQPCVAGDIVGGQGLLQPADIERLIGPGAADGVVDGKGLVGVGKNLEARADRLADRGDAPDILVNRPADLQLATAKAVGLGAQRVLDQGGFGQM